MNLYLTRFGTHTAVIAADNVGQARRVFLEKVTAVADRAQIKCRTIRGVSLDGASDVHLGGKSRLIQSIVD